MKGAHNNHNNPNTGEIALDNMGVLFINFNVAHQV